MINQASALLYLGLFYVFGFPIGYLLLRWGWRDSKLPFFVEVPIFLSLGLVALTFTLFISSFLVIYQNALLLLFLLSSVVTLLCTAIGVRKRKGNFRRISIGHTSLLNMVPAILFAITFLHFSFVIGLSGWPPFGDAIKHGLITSLLVANGRSRLDYMPLSSAPLDNPTGFHVLSASFSMATGILPGESIFVLAAALLILVPSLLYSLTYLITRSSILSAAVFFSAFISHPVVGLDTYLTGYLYNGPYPNLFGFLGSILFCVLAVADEDSETRRRSVRSKLLMLLVIFVLLITYSPFAFFPAAYLVLKHFKGALKAAYRIPRRKLILIVIILAVLVIVSLLLWNYLYEIGSLIFLKLGKVYIRATALAVTPAFLLSQSGIAVAVATFIAVFFLLKRMNTTLALFYVVVVLPCFASAFEVLSPTVSILLPSRSIVIGALLSWVLIFAFLGYMLKIEPADVARFGRLRLGGITREVDLHSIRTATICLILVSTLFVPSFISEFTLGQTRYGWFGITRDSENYSVLLWVHENIAPDDLILNDFSYSSLYLLSFSIKNVTSHQALSSPEDRQRATDAHSFWKKPDDYVLFSVLVNKYDIKYVLVTYESGYLNWAGVGGDNTYKPRPFGSRTKLIFDDNPYLETLFETEHAGVYRVVSELTKYNSAMIVDDRQKEFWMGEATGSGTISWPVLSDDSDVKMSGDDSLKISVTDGSYAHISIVHQFGGFMDWSQQNLIAFYWFGNKTGVAVELFVKGPTTFDYMRYEFVESWKGWRLLILPLQVPIATYGNPDLIKVIQIQFTILNATQGTWRLDQLALASKKK